MEGRGEEEWVCGSCGANESYINDEGMLVCQTCLETDNTFVETQAEVTQGVFNLSQGIGAQGLRKAFDHNNKKQASTGRRGQKRVRGAPLACEERHIEALKLNIERSIERIPHLAGNASSAEAMKQKAECLYLSWTRSIPTANGISSSITNRHSRQGHVQHPLLGRLLPSSMPLWLGGAIICAASRACGGQADLVTAEDALRWLSHERLPLQRFAASESVSLDCTFPKTPFDINNAASVLVRNCAAAEVDYRHVAERAIRRYASEMRLSMTLLNASLTVMKALANGTERRSKKGSSLGDYVGRERFIPECFAMASIGTSVRLKAMQSAQSADDLVESVNEMERNMKEARGRRGRGRVPRSAQEVSRVGGRGEVETLIDGLRSGELGAGEPKHPTHNWPDLEECRRLLCDDGKERSESGKEHSSLANADARRRSSLSADPSPLLFASFKGETFALKDGDGSIGAFSSVVEKETGSPNAEVSVLSILRESPFLFHASPPPPLFFGGSPVFLSSHLPAFEARKSPTPPSNVASPPPLLRLPWHTPDDAPMPSAARAGASPAQPKQKRTRIENYRSLEEAPDWYKRFVDVLARHVEIHPSVFNVSLYRCLDALSSWERPFEQT